MKSIKVKASPRFIQFVKDSIVEQKKRHEKILKSIPPELIDKLRKKEGGTQGG